MVRRKLLFVQEQRVRWTYAELEEGSDVFAIGMLSLGLQLRDRVGIWAANRAK
jgi:long-subunit acyl-CoA synthetase (AMP-forming)